MEDNKLTQALETIRLKCSSAVLAEMANLLSRKPEVAQPHQ